MSEFTIVWNVLPFNKGRTKWEVLEARRMALRLELQKIDRDMAGLEQTTCGLICSGCGELLETEKDFAAHFVIPNEQYLNLGECPHR